METASKGNSTEAAVLNAFVAHGFDVLLPFGSGHPYDLVVDLSEGAFLRVRCKTGRPVGGCVAFNGHRTDHGHGRRSYIGLADVFGVFFPPRQAVYLVPVKGVPSLGPRLRLEPTRNNQRQGIRFAADYEIDRWSTESLKRLISSGESRTEALSFA